MEAVYNANEPALQDAEDTKSDFIEETLTADEGVTEEPEDATSSGEIDYEALISSDLDTLRTEFPELRGIKEITDLNNPLRYAALRDLGLTPEEAYLATAKRRTQDTRAHLRSAHGRSAATPTNMMSQQEMAMARDLFPDLSDSDLQRLYKKVTK